MARRATETSEDTIRVEVGALGSEVKTVVLEEGATVADALQAAGYPEDSEVKCSGETYAGSDVLDDGDSLLVLAGQKIKGGN